MTDDHPDRAFDEGQQPAELLEQVREWVAFAQPIVGKRVEIFHRRATRVRVVMTGTENSKATAGVEEGVALRTRDLDGRREGFAAAACGPAGVPLEWLTARANVSTSPATTPWRDSPVRLVDVENDADLPSIAELTDWLMRARRALEGADFSGASTSAWIEAALTVESLVHDGGLAASRSRLRVWATATHRDRSLPDSPERPHMVAARRLDRLDPEAWAASFDALPDGARTPSRASDRPIAFEPEAAAALAMNLVPILHGPSRIEVDNVGAGWVVADEPCHPDALVGGAFDDAGFAAERTVLAGEGKILGRLDGPGFLRRASYRDRPEPLSSLVVVAGQDAGIPDEAWRIRAVRIHAGGAEPWVIELDGVDGKTGATVRGATLFASPDRLVAACVGSFGSPRQAGWGVITPGLILEGLRVEG